MTETIEDQRSLSTDFTTKASFIKRMITVTDAVYVPTRMQHGFGGKSFMLAACVIYT